ncbi:uncharacterized protein N7458_009712 [Penicillium daleae]|uniref:Uncharacterized protein n=1 Tax=Penicillium daleae TaxID=63821 RepID=A0AAD6C089_9EURO|nr:uncharacterized protein N7458_009712 [Penicillium daleae]KAJ5438714.1 hypothetical protein N7458_009712 [Penicillium daleae]
MMREKGDKPQEDSDDDNDPNDPDGNEDLETHKEDAPSPNDDGEDVNKHTYGYENEDGTYTIVKGYVPPDQ